MIRSFVLVGFFWVCIQTATANSGEVIKADWYYISITERSNGTGSSSKNQGLYLRAMLSSKDKMSDVILDEYTAVPSSQWEVKRKTNSSFYSLTPKANRNNAVTYFGGNSNDPETGFRFKSIDGQWLIERVNPQSSDFYLKGNGQKVAVTFERENSNMSKKGSKFLWKMVPVSRLRTTDADTTTTTTALPTNE